MLQGDGKRMGRSKYRSRTQQALMDGRRLDDDTLKPERSFKNAKLIISLPGLKLSCQPCPIEI